MTGKGDISRPLSVPPETFAQNWEQTFAVTEPVVKEPPRVIDWTPNVIRVPIVLRRPLETLGDPDE